MPTVQPWTGNVQFPGGTKDKNDAYTGEARTLSIDTEQKNIRVHDGLTPGGTTIAAKTTGLMSWDGAVVAALGTYAEGSSVSASCKAYTVVMGSTVSYSVTAGALPPGLSVNSNGTITGTIGNIVANAGYAFTITATDGTNSISKAFTLNVTATNNAPTWNTASALGTISATNASVQLSATDPEGQSLTYTLASGALPAGWSLSSAGLITGTNPKDGNTYNFTVNVSDGTNTVARAFSMTLPAPVGEAVYTSPGTYTWVCPTGVTTVSAMAVGGGGGYNQTNSSGGAGGGLGWKNNIAVTPGQSYTVLVGDTGSDRVAGGDSYFLSSTTVKGGGGGYGGQGIVGNYTGDGGGTGGAGGAGVTYKGGGGGGAGGYSGAGGAGGTGGGSPLAGSAGAGGGGGGGASGDNSTTSVAGPGGGVGLFGQGANGTAGQPSLVASTYTGGAGSGGNGGLYGGGGGGQSQRDGHGAVRIIWGAGRSFPSAAA